jgi:hypothetical protein
MLAKATPDNSRQDEGDRRCSTEAQSSDVLLDLWRGPVRFSFNTPEQKWDGNGKVAGSAGLCICNNHLQAMLSGGLQGPTTACWRMLLYGIALGFITACCKKLRCEVQVVSMK